MRGGSCAVWRGRARTRYPWGMITQSPSPGEELSWPGYSGAFVVDGLGFIGDPDDRSGALPDRLPSGVVDAMARSGVTAVNVTVGTVGAGTDLFERTIASLGRWGRIVDANPDVLARIRSVRDIRSAKEQDRLGVIFGFQDAAMLEGQADRVGLFADLGVRVIQLTYNDRNDLGCGAIVPEDTGLTDFGRAVVERMDAQRLLVDLSHCGHRTTAEGIAASTRPVAITHSGCAALADLPRNKRDQELRALADSGGVFGVYLMPFLRERGQPDAADVVRHIEHALDVCGEDHVGVGTDGTVAPVTLDEAYRAQVRAEIARRREAGISAPGETDDIVPLIPDLNHERRLEHLADHLSRAGHPDARIEKILGGNFLRLFEEVWGG